MASPGRPSNGSSETPRSSPVRRSGSGRRRDKPNGHHRHHSVDGSQQLAEELTRVLIDDDRAFQKLLTEQSRRQQRLHVEALDRALAKHEAVRQSAERAKEQWELESQRARIQQEENERRAVLEANRKLAEEKEVKRRQEEEDRRREEERRKLEAQRKEQEAAEAERRRKEEEERHRQQALAREKEIAEKKAQEEAAAQAKQKELQEKTLQQTRSAPSNIPSSSPALVVQGALSQQTPAVAADNGLLSTQQERDRIHATYMELHKRLKNMRQEIPKACSAIHGLKNQVSDWRRQIAKCCGQLAKTDRATSQRAMKEILGVLDQAAQITQPSIDISQYIISDPSTTASGNTQGSGVLLFLLNTLVKHVINQLISEAAVDAPIADPVSILTVTVFANPKYQLNGHALIDIFWAKYHAVCPILFGICGPENTLAGRKRLRWADDKGSPPEFVPAEEHYNRMRGLGAGFAAMTLRDFSRSKNRNPVPNRMYWEAVARIVNTPTAEQCISHYVVLSALLHETFLPRFLAFYGQAALAALRKATMDFPASAPTGDPAMKPHVQGLHDMPLVLQRDLHLTL